MLMEEVLSNIGWTSTAVFQTDVLASISAARSVDLLPKL